MSKSPSFQFYAQDFLAGTMYLTNEEIGIYIKMLAKQWTDEKIPKKRLGLLVGIEWESFSDELKGKFEDKGDFVLNKRLEIERVKKENFLNKQSLNGSKGGRPPKPKLNPNETQQQSQKKPLEDEYEILDKGGLGEKDLIDFKNQILEEGNTQWMQALYIQYKLKEKTFSFIVDDFILHLQCSEDKKHPKTLSKFKSHLYNWCNRVDPIGKLNKYKKHQPKQNGQL